MDNFVCLDELIQVIYTALHRFILISTVSDSWVVHLGLVGPEGRWFRGAWNETDIRTALKLTPKGGSDKLLEGFATKLANFIVEGMLHVEGIEAEDADPKLSLGPSEQPLYMPLVELSSADAATYTSNFLLDFALQAQSRKCAIYPSAFLSTPLPTSRTIKAVKPRDPPPEPEPSGSVEKKRKADPERGPPPSQRKELPKLDPKVKPVVQPRKGASLANPTKKARKFHAIEFASDEE